MGVCRSADLRLRVVEAVAAGSSRRAAAERFAVSVSSAIRWSARASSEGSACQINGSHWTSAVGSSEVDRRAPRRRRISR